MNRFYKATAIGLAAFSLLSAQALAQYTNEFVQAKLIKEGKYTTPIAGSGKVVVQVQVNADGTHKVTKVISSTNPGDNQAAMEIAQTSTYRPAHRGSTPVVAFYDFTFKFNGKTLVNPESSNSVPAGTLSPAARSVAVLIEKSQYSQAERKAQSDLMSAPSDDSLREMLGLAAVHAGDYQTAVDAFDKVPNIGPSFREAAAAAYAGAAISIVNSPTGNAVEALGYAQKAMALKVDFASQFALGKAQLANGDKADALASLKAAAAGAMADSAMPVSAKINYQAGLIQAYLANNDQQNAEAVAAQIKQMDPSSNVGSIAMAKGYYYLGQSEATAKNTEAAVKDYEQAAALGGPQIAVTAYSGAAFAIAQSANPDWKRVQSYADKALALNPDDAFANYAEGVALAKTSNDAASKKKALDALNRADAEAKASGNEALSIQIESIIKNFSGGP